MAANTDIYKVTEELKEKGWLYDDTGVYVPYTHKNEDYHDYRSIYLKISRLLDLDNYLVYTFVKLEDGLFYPMESCFSNALISDEDKQLKRKISHIGIKSWLNAGKGIYIDFVDSIKKDINDVDCLNVLKVEDFAFPNEIDLFNLTLRCKKNKHHNFMNMMDLMKLILGEPYYDYSDKGRTMYLCPFHDDHKPSAEASYHVFRCYTEKIQLDQTGILMKIYGLKTPQDAEEKFQELMK